MKPGSIFRCIHQVSRAVFLFALLTGNLHAQDLSIERPILGFTADQARASISPIVGVVGASVLDQSLDLGINVGNAVISPEHNYALAEQSEDAKIVLLKVLESRPTVVELSGLYTGPSLISISPRGTAAAFLNRASGFLQTFRGMPNAPELVHELDTSVIPGEPTGIAVNDDGNIALINVADRDAGSSTAWVSSSSGALWAVPSSHVSAMAFLPRRYDAIFADAESQEIFLVLDLSGTGNRVPLLSLNGPTGTSINVGSSQDGKLVYALSAASTEVTIVDAETYTSTAIDCSCWPTRLERLKGNAVLLDAPPADLLHVLDVSAAEPRIVVIPAQPTTPQQEGSEGQ
jgi:WD40 repeat protein